MTTQKDGSKISSKKKRKGLVIVNTGDGKGKSTAAFGIAFRARGRGMDVAVIQFLKPDTANYGEIRAARAAGIMVEGTGDGWTWTSKDINKTADLARKGWQLAQQKIIENQVQILILDEFTYPMVFEWISVTEVIDWLKQNKPKDLHIVITGRDAPKELIGFADLVTEMKLIKHPYEDQNIKAQPGIEF